jgi:hypothetical protein
LIIKALENEPEGLRVCDIYKRIEKNIDVKRTGNFRNSVRHALSSKKALFIKSCPDGKRGSFWKLTSNYADVLFKNSIRQPKERQEIMASRERQNERNFKRDKKLSHFSLVYFQIKKDEQKTSL